MRLVTKFLTVSLLMIMTLTTGCGGGGGGGTEYTLNIRCDGYGRVTDTSGYTIVTRKIPAGTTVTLVPTGETGSWAFNRWDGQDGTEVINNTIAMNGDKNITAVFSRLTCNVNITIVGEGTVSQELVVGALSLPTYKGDKVRLVPAPAPGWELEHWEGDINTTAFAPEIIVDTNKNITAVFIAVISYHSFYEDVETASSLMKPEGTWGKTTASSHSTNHSWTDSPDGNYNNNVDISLTSKTINMNGSQMPHLVFWHKYTLESGYDYCRVEISTNGGSTWTLLKSYTGSATTWVEELISLNAYKTQNNVILRFRLTSDSSITMDGWYVDDIGIYDL